MTTKKRLTRGRPSKAQSDAIEQRLVRCARAEFVRRGYGEASPGAIACAAGVTKMTLYRKFDGKPALFRAVVNAELARFTRPFDTSSCADLEEALRLIGDRLLEEWDDGFIEVIRLVFAEANRAPELSAVMTALSRETRDAVVPALKRFSRGPVDHVAAADFFLQLLFMGPNRHLIMDGDKSYQSAARRAEMEVAINVFLLSWRQTFGLGPLARN